MNDELGKKLVRDAYEDPHIVAQYSGDIGLWKAEEILLQRYFPRKGNLLDIGCGAGRTSIPLAQLGFDVVGIDTSPSMLKAAITEANKFNLTIDFHEMDAKSLSFDDQSFDCALFSFNGMDHIQGYQGKLEVLREVFRVLKPEAPFIFSSHRIWSPFHIRKLIWSGLKMSFGKILRLDTLEKEWGELYDLNSDDPRERYSSFLSTRRWKRALVSAGFDFICCESRYRLESHSPRELIYTLRSGNIVLYLSGNFMLYVARKPAS